MKLDGRGGRAIVDAVVKNSSTFADKTEYAKEKYVRKKQKKCVLQISRSDQAVLRATSTMWDVAPVWYRHLVIVVVLRPSARTLCQAHHVRDPKKIG